MNLFYAPNILETPFLPEEESSHCVRVLRHKAGDRINLIDGKGNLYDAELVSTHPKHAEVRILSVHNGYGSRPFRLHLAVAPTKNIDRFEWFVEKATEIGFDALTPLSCRFSERKVIKPERIEKILVSATKQSLKAAVPQLNGMTDFNDFVKSVAEPNRYIAHCHNIEKEHLLRVCAPASDVVVLVGPEGDFSREEVDAAMANGFQGVSLGESRLRTETAGIVACHLVTVANLRFPS
jgi:16S rRNA (uracil1498-N3)-methyltransferase